MTTEDQEHADTQRNRLISELRNHSPLGRVNHEEARAVLALIEQLGGTLPVDFEPING